MEIKIIKTGDAIAVTSPYNPSYTSRAKKLGGKWDASQSAWVFNARSEPHVRELLLDEYGSDGSPAELVDIRVTTLSDIRASARPITLCGRVVVSARGRDSGARLGEGVSLIKGRAASGGSVKNWVTMLTEGAVFEMFDVPRRAVESCIEVGDDEFQIEIIRAGEQPDERAQNCAAIAESAGQIADALSTSGDQLDEELSVRALNELAETRRQMEALLAALRA